MTGLITVLFILSLCVFLFCIYFLVKYQDQIKLPQIPPYISFNNYVDQMQLQMDYKSIYQRTKESISLKYKEINMLFDEYPCKNAYILHFKGNSRKKENIVYVLRNESIRDLFLSAVEDFIEEARTPKYGIIIVLPFTSDNQEFLSVIQEKKLSLKYIYTDESNIVSFPHMNGMIAMVSIGRKPYACFDIENDTEEYDWLAELNSQIFEPVYTKETCQTVASIRHLLPFDIQIASYFYPLFSKMVMKEILYLYPELSYLFYPAIEKKENQIIIYAPNSESLTNSISILEKNAKDHKIMLKQTKIVQNTTSIDIKNTDYQRIHKCIKNTLNVDHIIPVYSCCDSDYLSNVPILSFHPLYQNTMISFLKTKQFYIKLLELRNSK